MNHLTISALCTALFLPLPVGPHEVLGDKSMRHPHLWMEAQGIGQARAHSSVLCPFGGT